MNKKPPKNKFPPKKKPKTQDEKNIVNTSKNQKHVFKYNKKSTNNEQK